MYLPLAPPLRKRPIRNITALSYSDTTLKHIKIDIGNVRTMIMTDIVVAKISTQFISSFSAETWKYNALIL